VAPRKRLRRTGSRKILSCLRRESSCPLAFARVSFGLLPGSHNHRMRSRPTRFSREPLWRAASGRIIANQCREKCAGN
jgi:hypothetical protein